MIDIEAAGAHADRRRAIGHVGAVGSALIASGLLVNLYLAIVARSVSPRDYLIFGSYWSISLIVGFGLFLPIEQELARRLPGSSDRRRLITKVFTVAVTLGLIEAAFILAVAPIVLNTVGHRLPIMAAIIALGLASAGQFVLRGVLIGTGRMLQYAVVIMVDAMLRVTFAILVSVFTDASSAGYAWTLVAAIGLSHLPLLAVHWRNVPSASPGSADHLLTTASLVRPIAALLIGSVGAQLILNGVSIVVAAIATPADQVRAGAFQAAFQLVRVPLFLAVPLQATIVPTMVRLVHQSTPADLARALGRFVAAIVALAGVGAVIGWVFGDWLMRTVFGREYDVPAAQLALLAAGVAAYLGLLIITQAMVAAQQHGMVGLSWAIGAIVVLILFLVVADPVVAAETAFAGGSVAGFLAGLTVVLTRQRRTARLV